MRRSREPDPAELPALHRALAGHIEVNSLLWSVARVTPVPGIVLGLFFATFTLVACGSTGGSSANEGGSGGTSSGGGGAISGGNAGHAGLGGGATGGAGSPGGAGGRTTGGGGNAASGGAAASAGVAATGGDPSIPVGGEPLCPADDWCWEHPLPQGNNLTGVFGTASDDVWVVGEGGNDSALGRADVATAVERNVRRFDERRASTGQPTFDLRLTLTRGKEGCVASRDAFGGAPIPGA